jgi:NTE family protein
MRALVLSGGSFKGAYQAGAIKHLLGDLKRDYGRFCGVSVGSLIAGFLAQFKEGDESNAAEKLCVLWKDLRMKDVYRRWFPFGRLHGLWEPSIYNSKPLRKFIDKHIDWDLVIRSGKELRVGAVSLDTGQAVMFDESFTDKTGALLASSSFPVAFLPIKIGESLTDGGVRDVTPLSAAIDDDITHVDVILCSQEKPKLTPLKNPNAFDVLVRVVDLMSSEIIEGDLRHAIPKAEAKGVKVTIMRPDEPLLDDSLQFSEQDSERLLELGYRQAKEVWSADE